MTPNAIATTRYRGDDAHHRDGEQHQHAPRLRAGTILLGEEIHLRGGNGCQEAGNRKRLLAALPFPFPFPL